MFDLGSIGLINTICFSLKPILISTSKSKSISRYTERTLEPTLIDSNPSINSNSTCDVELSIDLTIYLVFNSPELITNESETFKTSVSRSVLDESE